MSEGVRTLLLQGSGLYTKTIAAMRHFNAAAYEICERVLNQHAKDLGDSIGVSDLGAKKVRLHLYPTVDTATEWDETEVYIGAKIQLAPYTLLILYYYLGVRDDQLNWATGISLGFSTQRKRDAVMKQLLEKKDSTAASSYSYGTDCWLLDFSQGYHPLAEVDTFPTTLDEVVSCWLENCRAVGGINMAI